MKRKIWFSIGGGVFAVILLFILLSRVFTPGSSSASELTEQEAKEIAQQRYSGLVQEIKQEADDYIIRLERGTGLYELQINSKTGEVSSLKRINEGDNKGVDAEQPPPDHGQINEEPKQANNDVKEEQTILTEEKAAAIALEEVPGTVDDIDIENMNGVVYFLVEVEGNDGREATVEINAITGEVHSFTWDDEDDEDEDEDEYE